MTMKRGGYTRKVYTPEQKQRALDAYLNTSISLDSAARKFGVHRSTLSVWASHAKASAASQQQAPATIDDRFDEILALLKRRPQSATAHPRKSAGAAPQDDKFALLLDLLLEKNVLTEEEREEIENS